MCRTQSSHLPPEKESHSNWNYFSHRKHFSVFLLKIFSTSERSDGKKSCTTAPLTLKLGRSSRTTLRSNSFVHNEWNRVGKYRVNSHFSLASVCTLLLFDPPYFLFVALAHLWRDFEKTLKKHVGRRERTITNTSAPDQEPVLRIVLPGTTPNHSLPLLDLLRCIRVSMTTRRCVSVKY